MWFLESGPLVQEKHISDSPIKKKKKTLKANYNLPVLLSPWKVAWVKGTQSPSGNSSIWVSFQMQ